jgi:hypothetical protein
MPESGRSDQALRIAQAGRERRCALNTGFLLEPEQSTSAIVVHHPVAKYFGGVTQRYEPEVPTAYLPLVFLQTAYTEMTNSRPR